MSTRSRSRMNAVMGHFLTAVYIAMPTTCAVVVAYDIWNRGLGSLPAQIGIGIIGMFVTIRILSFGFGAADAITLAVQKHHWVPKTLVARWFRWIEDAAFPKPDRALAAA
ncbi:hypothetical protein G6L37_05245 [Agrobacterium rubi]|nr:hypothetical protein [Agrobacterium rubi]NTF24762.1 hypothetical protein [Agrobacterium rubi]